MLGHHGQKCQGHFLVPVQPWVKLHCKGSLYLLLGVCETVLSFYISKLLYSKQRGRPSIHIVIYLPVALKTRVVNATGDRHHNSILRRRSSNAMTK